MKPESLVAAREAMVRLLLARGIRDPRILAAFRAVPRELFVPAELTEFAYEDAPLPIEEGQTISQPYIVALMAEALQLQPTDRVLEIGAGSGYAAAILGELAAEVDTVERHAPLASSAADRLRRAGYTNVRVHHGDGSLGWAEHAPYDAIIVAAGGPSVPSELKRQLAPGGRIVMPVGTTPREQTLRRLVRRNGQFEEHDLGGVRFVPLIGEAGWADSSPTSAPSPTPSPTPSPALSSRARGFDAPHDLALLVAECCHPCGDLDDVDLEGFLDRVGDCRVVLLGEASHGTSEFYELRARLTRALILRKGFRIVAAEADWPDAAQVSAYVRHDPQAPGAEVAFSRFPTWMWRNREFDSFVRWLREHNRDRPREDRVGFFGLDLYSLYGSIAAVLGYLDRVDPDTAARARERYGCLTPWEGDPATYGRAAVTGRYRSCEDDAVAMLRALLERRLDYANQDGEAFLDAVQNARLVANAERYYRVMYYGSRDSWNLRDTHMFETLVSLLDFYGPDARAVVWAHNSHVGNAAATEMGARGEINIGHLCRQKFGDSAYAVGFGTHDGTVAAATDWGGPLEIKSVRPSHPASYERVCHDSQVPAFLLPLTLARREELVPAVEPPRLERAIGVIYRPEFELESHYFQASLPRQFDEWVWVDRTSALAPLAVPGGETEGLPDLFPFGL